MDKFHPINLCQCFDIINYIVSASIFNKTRHVHHISYIRCQYTLMLFSLAFFFFLSIHSRNTSSSKNSTPVIRIFLQYKSFWMRVGSSGIKNHLKNLNLPSVLQEYWKVLPCNDFICNIININSSMYFIILYQLNISRHRSSI